MPLPQGHKPIGPIERRRIRRPITFSTKEKDQIIRKIERYERILEKLSEKQRQMIEKYGRDSEEAHIAKLSKTKVQVELEKLDFSIAHMELLEVEKKLKKRNNSKLLDQREYILDELNEISRSVKRKKAELAKGLDNAKTK